MFQKNIGEEKNSLYHGLSVSVIIEDTFQFTVNAKYNICFGKQFIQNGGNICFKQGILQDSMGAKIFRYILEYLDEDITALPMRDILNRLERYLIIPSADEWTYIRETCSVVRLE